MVPGAGIEPARPQWPRDFKSLVSTSFTIRARNLMRLFRPVFPHSAREEMEAGVGIEPAYAELQSAA